MEAPLTASGMEGDLEQRYQINRPARQFAVTIMRHAFKKAFNLTSVLMG